MKTDDHKTRISMIIDGDKETGEIGYYGDPTFQEAADYLRQRVDGIFAENYRDETEGRVDDLPVEGDRTKVKRLS